MTAPYRPPPKSLDGRSARELIGSSERTTDNGDDVLPPAGPLAVPDDSMHVGPSGWLVALVEQPEEAVAYFPRSRIWRDGRGRTHVRVVTDVDAVGAATAELYAAFTDSDAADESDPADWTEAGALGTTVAVPLTDTGPEKSTDWIPLHASARTDVRWQVFGRGGDGATTPVVSNTQIQWRTGAEPAMEKWYWRDLVPSAQPDEFTEEPPCGGGLQACEVDELAEINQLPAYNISDTSPFMGRIWAEGSDEVRAYTSPTEAEVQNEPRVLSRTRAPNNAAIDTFQTSGDEGAWGFVGPMARLVGPPLAAQSVPSFAYEHWYSAQAPSANTDGTVQCLLWVWRPGVGRVAIGGPYPEVTEAHLAAAVVAGGIGSPIGNGYYIVWDPDNDAYTISAPRTAMSESGGHEQKYVRFVSRQCRNWGVMRAFEAEAGDRFILDLASANNIGGPTNQGFGVLVNYNGTVEPTDPEGLADEFPGTASYTSLPRLRYTGT